MTDPAPRNINASAPTASASIDLAIEDDTSSLLGRELLYSAYCTTGGQPCGPRLTGSLGDGKPVPRAIAHRAYRKHHWHFDEDSHNGGQRRTGLWAKERDRSRHSQLEEVARSDQRSRCRDRVVPPE